MQADGIIERYAIGGAVGASFYLEPMATIDLDVFVSFRAERGSQIVSPKPIFDYLIAKGGKFEGEFMVVGGWPVQFLPPTSQLVDEALREAVEKDVGGIRVWVFSPEHLAAIALETGRAKDKIRLQQFMESGGLQPDQFRSILSRFGLQHKWERFQKSFLEENQ